MGSHANKILLLPRPSHVFDCFSAYLEVLCAYDIRQKSFQVLVELDVEPLKPVRVAALLSK